MKVIIFISIFGVAFANLAENGLDNKENLTEVQEVGESLLVA